MRFESVSTDRLRPGDLLMHHGMRIRLGDRHEYVVFGGGPAWWFPGTIENIDEVRKAENVAAALVGDSDQWPIQGNAFATWFRIVPDARPEDER
jgi:hypothetical protein